MTSVRRLFPYLVLSVLLAGCDLAPDYQPPATQEPPTYREAGDWMVAQPADAISRDGWWTVFHDPQLDALEAQVAPSNQTLKAAVAQYEQARAAAGIARAAYFPVITASSGASRQKLSTTLANNAPNSTYNDFTFGADLTYEVDLFGRVRNTVAANEHQAEATAADVESLDLMLHADLANDYFSLRGDDAAQLVLDKTVIADQQAFDLTQRRYQGGVSAEVDVDQAQTQLENAKTQALDMRRQRAQLEHAIAILIGKAPAEFNLAPAVVAATAPNIDVPLPSQLLQRRPDIAAAERRVAAANAEIGVARAAYFPVFNIAAMAGFESSSVAHWLSAPSNFWSFGPSAVTPLFEGGELDALNDQARAAYDQSVANYRQTVLTAYGDVEDNLVALRQLQQESVTQAAATKAAKRALAQANDRYTGGVTTFIDVVVAQNNELQSQLGTVNVQIEQLIATVQLIRALGGGWGTPVVPPPQAAAQ